MLLAATVVGSGVMAERLAGGNVAIALLANTAATVAVLATLIALFAPLSGAHFNPAVSFIETLRGRLSWKCLVAYAPVQIAGCCAGALLAHAMFELPLLQASAHIRTGPAQWLAEGVATCGLVLVVVGHRRAAGRPVDDRGLDRSCLLVYRIDLVRKPRDHDSAIAVGQLRRDPPGRCTGLHCSAVHRRRGCACSGSSAVQVPDVCTRKAGHYGVPV